MSTDKAASDLARKRWRRTSKEERAQVGKDLNEARNAALSAKRRSEIARKAAEARWGKKK